MWSSYEVKDLKAGMIVWESCQYGNVRLRVMGDATCEDGFWTAPCLDDFDNPVEQGCAEDHHGYGHNLYEQPMYGGVPWVCDPANIPKGPY